MAFLLYKCAAFITILNLVDSEIYNVRCPVVNDLNEALIYSFKQIVKLSYGEKKGDNGRIAVVAGSAENPGAAYFTAITSLKAGADLVYVVTPREASPAVKSYSPDLIVVPYLQEESLPKIFSIIDEADVVVIGPGLGRNKNTLKVVASLIDQCKERKKPTIISADAIYVVAKNLSLIQNYPEPGVILTLNKVELGILETSVKQIGLSNITDLGQHVSIFVNGLQDRYLTNLKDLQWVLGDVGSKGRIAGQSNLVVGALGTYFQWSLKHSSCNSSRRVNIAGAVASLAAAKLVRLANEDTFAFLQHSMTLADMLKNVHFALNNLVYTYQSVFNEIVETDPSGANTNLYPKGTYCRIKDILCHPVQ